MYSINFIILILKFNNHFMTMYFGKPTK